MRLASNKVEVALNLAIVAAAVTLVLVFLAPYLSKQRGDNHPAPAIPVGSQASVGQKIHPIIDPRELMPLMTGGEKMVILDIRPREAFKSGHLPKAKSIPIDELGIRAEDELSRDSLIVLYADCSDCGGANETPELQIKLNSLGFTRVTRLQGGLAGWRQAGFEIVKD